MQLLIILALLLYGGKRDVKNILEEVKPVLENLGGEEMAEAIKSAEQISSVLSAVNAFSSGFGGGAGHEQPAEPVRHEPETRPDKAFPLKPVNDIMDRDIAYCLSKYITENA